MPKKKPIGLWSAVSIGVGGMIGAGIFSILGTACQIGGNGVYISFIIAGFIALFSTYSYAKLGTRYPSAGGPVEFLAQSFGGGIVTGGFTILLWLGYIIALSLYARAFAAYAMTFFHNPPSILLNVLATSIVLVFTGIGFVGAKAVGDIEVIIVTIKVGILVIFAVAGLFFMAPGQLTFSRFPPLNSIFFAAAIVFLAYEGFGLITNAAEDMSDPKKLLPKALYLSVLIVILIYVGVSIAVIGNLPLSSIIKAKDYALAEAAKPFLGLIGFKIIAIAALFSTASAINATLYGGANVSYMIAKDGELPLIFERKVWHSGKEGLLITAALIILFTNLFDLSKIAMVGSALFLIIYASVNLGHLKLYKMTGGKPVLIWTAILGNLISFFILTYYLWKYSMLTLIAIGVILFFSFSIECVYRKLTKREIKPRKN